MKGERLKWQIMQKIVQFAKNKRIPSPDRRHALKQLSELVVTLQRVLEGESEYRELVSEYRELLSVEGELLSERRALLRRTKFRAL